MTEESRWLTLAIVSVLAMIVLLFSIKITPARDLSYSPLIFVVTGG